MKIQLSYNVITTSKVKESVQFYTTYFGFDTVADLGWYVQLKDKSSGVELAFMEPNHPSQPPEYQKEYNGEGIILSFQVQDAKVIYELFKKKDLDIFFDLTKEEWGQLHFGVYDPNKIPVDIVQHID